MDLFYFRQFPLLISSWHGIEKINKCDERNYKFKEWVWEVRFQEIKEKHWMKQMKEKKVAHQMRLQHNLSFSSSDRELFPCSICSIYFLFVYDVQINALIDYKINNCTTMSYVTMPFSFSIIQIFVYECHYLKLGKELTLQNNI